MECITLTMGCPFNSLLIQVQRLLEVMGLEEHQEAFRRQQLNGDLFSECDEDILVNELKVLKVTSHAVAESDQRTVLRTGHFGWK